MIKGLVIFALGVFVGGAILGTSISLPLTSKETTQALKIAGTKARQVIRDQCVHSFNDRTHCRQDKKFTSQECDTLIDAQCGPDPEFPATKEARMK